MHVGAMDTEQLNLETEIIHRTNASSEIHAEVQNFVS